MNYDKFTKKALLYDKYRPKYSEKLIDYLYNNVGFSSESVIADIGAGTGILSEEFLKRGSKVICVEPNNKMLEQARQKMFKYRNFSYINSFAENTMIDESTVDAITVGQAFHWFDKKKFLEECKRILIDDGNVVLAWNVTDSEAEVNKKIHCLNVKTIKDYNGYNARDKEDNSNYNDFFNNMSYYTFDNDLLLNKDEFVGRCLSRSYAPNISDNNYEAYVTGLSNIFDLYSRNNKVRIKNKTKCILGKVK